MATPAKAKLKHYRGDDFRYTFKLTEYTDETQTATQPIDMTGWSAEVESDPDIAFAATTPDATGIVTVAAPWSAMSSVVESLEVFELDVKLTDDSDQFGPGVGFGRTYIHLVVALTDQVA